MRFLLTQAKTHDLAVEAVQAAIHAGLARPLLPCGFEVVPNARVGGGWHIIYMEREEHKNKRSECEALIMFLREYLGYIRYCNRCNERVENTIVWICPKCNCNEWRLKE